MFLTLLSTRLPTTHRTSPSRTRTEVETFILVVTTASSVSKNGSVLKPIRVRPPLSSPHLCVRVRFLAVLPLPIELRVFAEEETVT